MASFLLLDKQDTEIQGPRFNPAQEDHKPQKLMQEGYPVRVVDFLPSSTVGQVISVPLSLVAHKCCAFGLTAEA